MEFESFIYTYDKYRDDVEAPVTVVCDINYDDDGYATGDSPAHIEITNLKVYRDGELYNKYLDNATLEDIEDEAIERYNEERFNHE